MPATKTYGYRFAWLARRKYRRTAVVLLAPVYVLRTLVLGAWHALVGMREAVGDWAVDFSDSFDSHEYEAALAAEALEGGRAGISQRRHRGTPKVG